MNLWFFFEILETFPFKLSSISLSLFFFLLIDHQRLIFFISRLLLSFNIINKVLRADAMKQIGRYSILKTLQVISSLAVLIHLPIKPRLTFPQGISSELQLRLTILPWCWTIRFTSCQGANWRSWLAKSGTLQISRPRPTATAKTSPSGRIEVEPWRVQRISRRKVSRGKGDWQGGLGQLHRQQKGDFHLDSRKCTWQHFAFEKAK